MNKHPVLLACNVSSSLVGDRVGVWVDIRMMEDERLEICKIAFPTMLRTELLCGVRWFTVSEDTNTLYIQRSINGPNS